MTEEKQVSKGLEKYGKLDIKLTGTRQPDEIKLEGKPLPVHRIIVDADVDTTEVELTLIQLPTGEPYTIEGYLVSEDDYELLQDVKRRNGEV